MAYWLAAKQVGAAEAEGSMSPVHIDELTPANLLDSPEAVYYSPT